MNKFIYIATCNENPYLLVYSYLYMKSLKLETFIYITT